MSKPTVVIGVDNGISGGLCALDAATGAILSCKPMPLVTESGKEEPCVATVAGMLDELTDHDCVFAVEEPLKHAKSSQAVRSMALSFGKLVAVAECHMIPVIRVQVGEWQTPMLGKVPKGQTKVAALRTANILWPNERWLPTARHRVAHDGMVDAALIAEFVRRRFA
jgi:hypothetical protein